MLADPAATTAILLADRFASHTIAGSAAAWTRARGARGWNPITP